MSARFVIVSLVVLLNLTCFAADRFIVENGVPKASIVISETPTRMQRVAAEEFRMQVEKISGARLPIVNSAPDDGVKVYIGASATNPAKADGLEKGAYRIATGPDWIALIGDDTDFEPKHPYAASNSDIPRAQAEWEGIVGAPYGMPSTGLYKNRLRLPGNTGKPDGATTAERESLEIWGLDERGSFNAVCGYLRTLGARWYLPGDIGEILPAMKTISLPEINETVIPDFPMRQFNFRFGTAGYDTSMWAMRLGIRNEENIQIAHGMARMTNNERVFAEHPEWFALYGGKRDFDPGSSKCQLCYSDEGLFLETVRYARALLDTYRFEGISIMPPDGYTAICQCEKCDGKDSPERHERGRLSNHIWEFTNRVAREIAKTHPDAKIVNGGYGVYTLPPDNIDKVEPNVLVCLVGGRRPINKAGYKGEGESAPERLRAEWAAKSDNPIIFFENYPFTDRGWYLPCFSVKSLTESVNATKGISMGEDIWLSAGRDFATSGIGFNHFLVYFTARLYWGGKDANGDALFREYCRLFYGPAEEEMHAFFIYCEENWKEMENEKERADKALALFAKAQSKVDASGDYGQRLALIDDYLKGLRLKSGQLGQKRGPVPSVRLVGDAQGIVIDGKLDDAYWEKCPTAATGKLRELQTGRTPTFGTSFKSGWSGNSLYFAIRCDELPGEKPLDAASKHDDPAIWKGDAIEIEIGTETHSYYQIAISPGGVIVDLDRELAKGDGLKWSSKAEVATRISDDHWTVEIRIPVTDDENDPHHQVIGRKPTQSLPWHINICRQRIRGNGEEFSALSPTGTNSFHLPLKFARLYAGQSHQFESDPEGTDFAIEFQNATRSRKAADFLALAGGKEITDFQKSAALEMAAGYSRGEEDPIIEQIPIEAVKKAAQMRQLLNRRDAPELIRIFSGEAISEWPFWKRGEGFHLRGRASQITQDGKGAEEDLSSALVWTSDPRARDSIRVMLAQNREFNLGNEEGSIEAYEAVVSGRDRLGGSDEYYALQGIARILTKRGQFDEALKTLDRAKVGKLSGAWQKNILESIEEVKAAKEAGTRE
ncbi:DUF4838 domain-containing protein [Verrucomicrobiales bacterium BCK34]|nr:DUF4838 domain-containing protein [Verrucomicrobiales bacterium BCK34]